jgi:ubiquinone/menaquinone biosynthesis C-methylase UbiE
MAGPDGPIVLVDAVAAMLDFAREKAFRHSFEMYRADLADLTSLSSASFDAILCTQVLRHRYSRSIVRAGSAG